ncbi:MAG TPA: hypothetical protein VFX16_01465 [Pseudonocardiaceae bacterium]|nr:hypothetical protein [Pseudonocardiaceae bacterium]
MLVIGLLAVVVAGAATGALLGIRSRGDSQVATVAPRHQPSAAATVARPVPEVPPAEFDFQPLWPFAGQADAAAWQQGYRASGDNPWHLDAATTALTFTQTYLGYTMIDKVIDTDPVDRENWVTIGFLDPGGRPVTSAVVHVARLGAGDDAPWEVVGTRDTTLSLTAPSYGSTVRSPVAVGGRITGVDETLTVRVRTLGRAASVGRVGGIAAGGQDSPWAATVPVSVAHGSVLTIAVSSGGHVAAVERFAITGVRY